MRGSTLILRWLISMVFLITSIIPSGFAWESGNVAKVLGYHPSVELVGVARTNLGWNGFIWRNDGREADDKIEKKALISCFISGLVTSPEDLWVNMDIKGNDLSILSNKLYGTSLGAIFMEADLQLKQDATEILIDYLSDNSVSGMDIFPRVWIVPKRIEVVAYNNGAKINDFALEVKLEARGDNSLPVKEIEKILTKRVNTESRYLAVRQAIRAVALAYWMKRHKYAEDFLDKIRLGNGVKDNLFVGNTKLTRWDAFVRYLMAYKSGRLGTLNYEILGGGISLRNLPNVIKEKISKEKIKAGIKLLTVSLFMMGIGIGCGGGGGGGSSSVDKPQNEPGIEKPQDQDNITYIDISLPTDQENATEEVTSFIYEKQLPVIVKDVNFGFRGPLQLNPITGEILQVSPEGNIFKPEELQGLSKDEIVSGYAASVDGIFALYISPEGFKLLVDGKTYDVQWSKAYEVKLVYLPTDRVLAIGENNIWMIDIAKLIEAIREGKEINLDDQLKRGEILVSEYKSVPEIKENLDAYRKGISVFYDNLWLFNEDGKIYHLVGDEIQEGKIILPRGGKLVDLIQKDETTLWAAVLVSDSGEKVYRIGIIDLGEDITELVPKLSNQQFSEVKCASFRVGEGEHDVDFRNIVLAVSMDGKKLYVWWMGDGIWWGDKVNTRAFTYNIPEGIDLTQINGVRPWDMNFVGEFPGLHFWSGNAIFAVVPHIQGGMWIYRIENIPPGWEIKKIITFNEGVYMGVQIGRKGEGLDNSDSRNTLFIVNPMLRFPEGTQVLQKYEAKEDSNLISAYYYDHYNWWPTYLDIVGIDNDNWKESAAFDAKVEISGIGQGYFYENGTVKICGSQGPNSYELWYRYKHDPGSDIIYLYPHELNGALALKTYAANREAMKLNPFLAAVEDEGLVAFWPYIPSVYIGEGNPVLEDKYRVYLYHNKWGEYFTGGEYFQLKPNYILSDYVDKGLPEDFVLEGEVEGTSIRIEFSPDDSSGLSGTFEIKLETTMLGKKLSRTLKGGWFYDPETIGIFLQIGAKSSQEAREAWMKELSNRAASGLSAIPLVGMVLSGLGLLGGRRKDWIERLRELIEMNGYPGIINEIANAVDRLAEQAGIHHIKLGKKMIGAYLYNDNIPKNAKSLEDALIKSISGRDNVAANLLSAVVEDNIDSVLAEIKKLDPQQYAKKQVQVGQLLEWVDSLAYPLQRVIAITYGLLALGFTGEDGRLKGDLAEAFVLTAMSLGLNEEEIKENKGLNDVIERIHDIAGYKEPTNKPKELGGIDVNLLLVQ